MKKDSSSQQSSKQMKKADRQQGSLTVGLDLGDKQSCYCVLDGRGEVIQEDGVSTNKKAIAKVFGSTGRCRIALEVGTHSPWVSRLLSALGHEVVVANPRQVKLIEVLRECLQAPSAVARPIVDNEIVGVDLPRNFNHCLVISFAPTLSILVADPRPKCTRRSFCER